MPGWWQRRPHRPGQQLRFHWKWPARAVILMRKMWPSSMNGSKDPLMHILLFPNGHVQTLSWNQWELTVDHPMTRYAIHLFLAILAFLVFQPAPREDSQCRTENFWYSLTQSCTGESCVLCVPTFSWKSSKMCISICKTPNIPTLLAPPPKFPSPSVQEQPMAKIFISAAWQDWS